MCIRTPDDVDEFGRAFQRLEELVGTRERYRRHDEIDLLLPVVDG